MPLGISKRPWRLTSNGVSPSEFSKLWIVINHPQSEIAFVRRVNIIVLIIKPDGFFGITKNADVLRRRRIRHIPNLESSHRLRNGQESKVAADNHSRDKIIIS